MDRQVSRRSFSHGSTTMNTRNIPCGHSHETFEDAIDEICGSDVREMLQNKLNVRGLSLRNRGWNMKLTIEMGGNERETIEIKTTGIICSDDKNVDIEESEDNEDNEDNKDNETKTKQNDDSDVDN